MISFICRLTCIESIFGRSEECVESERMNRLGNFVASIRESISDVFDHTGSLRYRNWLSNTTARAESALATS